MKTQALNWQFDIPTVNRTKRNFSVNTGSALQAALVILAAILPFALVSVVTIWAISAGANELVSAFYWASGFIFLALMVESNNGNMAALAGSGVTLMALAWLSSRVAPEFGVLAGFLLAAWVAAPVVRHLALRAAG